jgi:predicted CoA-binding protein
LKKHDFQIIPVNPSADKILGERSYKSLLDIPERIQKIIEIVNVFRPSEEVLKIVEQVIELKNRHEKPNVIWLQLGIASEKAAEIAKKAGLKIVMDKCIMIEHMRLFS